MANNQDEQFSNQQENLSNPNQTVSAELSVNENKQPEYKFTFLNPN